MKKLLEGALSSARGMMLPFVIDAVESGGQLTDQQALARYDMLHRGNAVSMASFVAERAPKGTHPMTALREYEQAMETLRQRGGKP